MPEQLSVTEFLEFTKDDVDNPSQTIFTSKLGLCRGTIAVLEEMLETDRSGLNKMKKSVKALSNSGKAHAANEVLLYENLEKLGANALSRDNETELGAAFLKFAVVTKELSNLLKHLVQSLENIVLFPLDSLLKGEIKGTKGDIKKALDRAIKDLDAKLVKIEKERKQLQKMETGNVKTAPTPEGLSQHQADLERNVEEAEKDRRFVQLQMCEFLIKVNEIKTKKGCELLQHLVEFYHAQSNFFQDGLKTVEQFQTNIGELTSELHSIHQRQDTEKRQLMELKTLLKQTIATYKEPTNTLNNVYSTCPPPPDKSYGSEKTGFLLKKSEGKMRRVWQRRKCMARGGFLHIYHSDESLEPTKLNLLTCQVKLPRLPTHLTVDDAGGGGGIAGGGTASVARRYFDLVSSAKNRTYHFQVEDDSAFEAWISVLNNSKEEALQNAFGNAPTGAGGEMEESSSVRELRNGILEKIRQLPGNKTCCDCGAPDPEWLSTNLGLLVCLECCGIHRDLGVHISRTQSTAIDNLGTAQLLVARAVGNALFNEIFEATLPPSHKLNPSSTMEARSTFIRSKYCDRRYAIQTTASSDGGEEVEALGEDLLHDLKSAVIAKDVSGLLQCLAERLDLFSPLIATKNDENALHLAIGLESALDGSTLHLIDFLIQNKDQPSEPRFNPANAAPRTHGTNVLDRPDTKGNTPLHLCAALNRTEVMKLLLRNGASIAERNAEGQTALDIAKEKEHQLCCDLLEQGSDNKSALFENVNIDWDLDPWKDVDNDAHSYSDDDLDHSESSAAAHNRQSPGSEKRRRLLSTLSNSSSTSRSVVGANQRPFSCTTPSKTDLATRREHSQSTAEATSTSHSPVLSERKRSHTSDSIINAVIGACDDVEEPLQHQEGSRTLHSTPAKSGGKENDSFSKSATLNRPKSGHGTLKKRPAPQPPGSTPQSSSSISYATPLRKNPLNAVASQRKSGSVSEGEETILRSATMGKPGRTNSAIYSHSLPRSHFPPRLGGDETPDVTDPDAVDAAASSPEKAHPGRKEGKGGKPPLIVFLPDGKGYVLPPFRDIQQENVTERVMAPVVWDADAEEEDGPEDETDPLRLTSTAGASATAAATTTTATTPTIQKLASENNAASYKQIGADLPSAPVQAPAPAQAPRQYSHSASQPPEPSEAHRVPSSDESQMSWKIRQKPSRPQLDSGLDSTSVSSTEMLDDVVIAPKQQQSQQQQPARTPSADRQPPQPQRRMSDMERRRSVEVDRRRTDAVLERRKSNQDVCRMSGQPGEPTVVSDADEAIAKQTTEMPRKTTRSISESIVPPKDANFKSFLNERQPDPSSEESRNQTIQGSPCRKSAEGAVQAARMMFERPAQPVYLQQSDKPCLEAKPTLKPTANANESSQESAAASSKATSSTSSASSATATASSSTSAPASSNVTLRASVASARAHFLANDASRPKSSTYSTVSAASVSSTSSSESASAKTASANPSNPLSRFGAKSFSSGENRNVRAFKGPGDVSGSATKRKPVFPLPTSNSHSSSSPQIPQRHDSRPNSERPSTDHQGRVRSRALYDCDADNEDELYFKEGEIIVVLSKETEDDGWWEGEIENEPQRHGIFPFTFVQIME